MPAALVAALVTACARGPDPAPRAADAQVWLCLERPGRTARNEDATIAWDEEARLGVVVRSGSRWYSDLGSVEIDGARIEPEPMGALAALRTITWYKIESSRASYRNTEKNPGWWADIEYSEHVVGAGRETVRPVDVGPVALEGVTWKARAVGTMRFKVALEMDGLVLSTPGAGAATRGGECPGVRRVSRMGGTGNAVADTAMSLANLPYVWGSAHVAPGRHQAEIHVGADCADLVVASWRMAGASRIGYSAVVPLLAKHSCAAVVIAGVADGFYVGAKGERIPFGAGGVEAGHAILWRLERSIARGHAAILVEDLGPGGKANGLLDAADTVLHAMWDTPRLEPVGEVLAGLVPAAALGPPGG